MTRKGYQENHCGTCGVRTGLAVERCGRCARDLLSGATGLRRINGRRSIYGMAPLKTGGRL